MRITRSMKRFQVFCQGRRLSEPSSGWLGETWIDLPGIESESATLLTPDGYAEHLVQAWEVAQRTIKGQANL